MPAYLKLNGIEVPVDGENAPTLQLKRQGAASRSYAGEQRNAYRARKREWKLRTVPLAREEAEALRCLVEGRGMHWSFNTVGGYGSDHGLAPTSLEGTHGTAGAANVESGSRYLYVGGYTGRVVYTLPKSAAWTLVDRSYLPNPVWQNRVIRSDGACWAGGVRDDAMDLRHQSYDASSGLLTFLAVAYGGAAWAANQPRTVDSTHVYGNYSYKCIVAGTTGATVPTWPLTYGATVIDGTVTWKNLGSGMSFWTDVAWLPYRVPDAWVAQLDSAMGAGTKSFGSLPNVIAEGTFTPEGPVLVSGEVGESEYVEFAQGGSRVMGEFFEFVLKEV